MGFLGILYTCIKLVENGMGAITVILGKGSDGFGGDRASN